MAVLKNLLVLGPSRLVQDTQAANITATKFITSGGTSSQFVKGDGTLDSTTYYYSGNLTLKTLVGSSNIGSTSQPVYYNGTNGTLVGITNNVVYTGTLVADEIATWNNTTGTLKSSGTKISGLLTSVSGGALSSSGNSLSLTALSVVVGGTTKSNTASTSVSIINSLSISTASSDGTNNLKLGITVNGQASSDVTVDNLYASFIETSLGSTDADHYLTFAATGAAASSGQSLYTDGDLKYNPSTNQLTTKGIIKIGQNSNAYFFWNPETTSSSSTREFFKSTWGNNTFHAGILTNAATNTYMWMGYGAYDSIGNVRMYPDGTMVHGYKTVLKGSSGGASTITSALDAVVIAPMPTRAGVGNYYPGLAFHSTTYNAAVQAWIGARCTSTAGSELSALVFATKSGTANSDRPVERMCILPDGKVGIGTTTPTYGLHHVGTSYFDGEATFPKILNVPTHDPSDTSSTTNASFWLGTGEYGADTGTGGGGGENLTITVNGSSTTYNGSSPASVTISVPAQLSDLTGTSELVKIQTLAATGTPSGFLKRASGGTWSFDTNTYLTASGNIASADKLFVVKSTYNGDFFPTFVDSSNATADKETFYTGDTLKFNPSSGMLTLAKLNLNREAGTTYGRIGFYKNNYYTWYEYMTNVTSGGCPTRATPPTGTYVTSWARRSLIENTSGYGWVWESSSNTANAVPTIQMELSSNTGNLKVTGSITGSSIVKSGGTSSQFLKADGSVDSNTYLTSASLSGYLPLAGGTMTGAGPINFTEGKAAINFRPNHTSYTTKVMYNLSGNEALMLSTKAAVTSIILNSGKDLVNDMSWYNQFTASAPPSMQIKGPRVLINTFSGNGETPANNLTVTGSSRFNGDVYIGSATTAQCHQQYDATNKCLNFIFD